MRFGIFSNGQRHNDLAAVTYEEDLWEIVAADQAGFDEVWLSEHAGIRPDVLPNADPMIAMAAAMTSRIKLAPAVRVLPALNPVDVATQAAVCDHLTRGRYMLGIGAGSEFKVFSEQRGIDHAERHERLLESLDIILKCWTEPGPVEYEGRFWRGLPSPVNPKPYTRPHPQIGMASDQDSIIELVAERGYYMLAAQYDGPAFLQRKGDVLAAARRNHGLEPVRSQYSVARMVHVADTTEQAWQNVRADVDRDFEYQLRIAPGNMLFFKQRNPGIEKLDLEDLNRVGLFMIGDSDSVYQQLEQFYRESGGFGGLLLVMGKDWGSREARERSLDLFMQKVAPRLAALETGQPLPSPATAGG